MWEVQLQTALIPEGSLTTGKKDGDKDKIVGGGKKEGEIEIQ